MFLKLEFGSWDSDEPGQPCHSAFASFARLSYAGHALYTGRWVQLPLDRLDHFKLRQILTTLALTLIVYSVSFGQNFKKDIKDGLYLWSAGFVIQETEDSLNVIQLRVSKSHFHKVAHVVYDSIARAKMLSESDPMWNMIKPSDTYRFIRPNKILDIVEFSQSRFSIILPAEKGFNSANFLKRAFGYELYFSNHAVKRRNVKESISKDTTRYFKLYAFTLTDLKKLGQLKNFSEIDQINFEVLLTSMQKLYSKNERILKDNMTFGIKIDGYETYGIIESREMIVKCLLEMKYNPLIDPNDLDKTRKKFEPRR